MGLPASKPRGSSSFLNRFGASIIVRFVGLGLQFGGSILIARTLGAEGFGAYSYAFTWAVMLGTVVGLGLDPLAVRELPRYIVEQDSGKFYGYIRAGFSMIFTMTLMVAGILMWLESQNYLVLTVGWLLVSLAAFLHAALMTMAAIMNALQRVVISHVIENLVRQVLFLGAIILLVLFGVSLTPADVFTLSIVVMVLTLPILFVFIRRGLSEQLTVLRADTTYEKWFWLGSSLPLLVWYVASQLQTNLDVIMVGLLSNDLEVGRYRTASRAVDLILIANMIAMQVMGPMLSRAIASKEMGEAQRLIRQCALAAFGLGTTLFIVLFAGAELYLALFHPDFVPAAPAMRILLAAQVFALIFGPVSTILVMLDRERTVLYANFVAIALNLALNLILIPRFGIEGAAIATLCALASLTVILTVVILKQTAFDPMPFGLARRLGLQRKTV